MLQVNNLTGFGASGVEIPSPPLTNLWGWWSAEEAYTETSGTPTTLITVDATAIGSLKDLSGNGRHMYQTTAADKPTFQTAEFGAFPSIRNATTDFMTTAAGVFPTLDGTYSVYIVFRCTTYGTNSALFSVNSNTPAFMLYQNGASGDIALGYTAATLTVNYPINVTHLLGGTWAPSGTFYLAKDGGAPSSVASPANAGSCTLVYIGKFGTGNSFQGEIAEVLFYDASHGNPNAGDGLLARQYLDAKYGLGFGL